MPTSQNGYPANDITRTAVRRVPGTDRDLRLVKGAPGWLLLHFAAWFHVNIEPITGGQLDDWGYAERTIRGSSTTLSNHASGTAIDLNAPKHWLGAVGTFTPAQTAKIRAQLKVYEGCIRWGGDYYGRKDEMHFEIMQPAKVCWRVRVKLTVKKVVTPAVTTLTPTRKVVASKVAAAAAGTRPYRYQVKLVQAALNAVTGAGLVVDGDWGPRTTTAYENFQTTLDLPVTGRPVKPELVLLAIQARKAGVKLKVVA